MYYIRSEDMGVVYIGPFSTAERAVSHMVCYFPAYRKVPNSGYKDEVVEQLEPGYMVISPEEDIINWEEEEIRTKVLAEGGTLADAEETIAEAREEGYL